MFLFLRLKVFGQCFNRYMLELSLLWLMTVVCALKQDHTKAIWFSKSVVTSHQLSCAGWPSAHPSTTCIAPVVDFTEVLYVTFGAGCEVTGTQLMGSKIIKSCHPFPIVYLDHQLQDQSPWELWMPTGATFLLKNLFVSQIEVQIVSWLKSRKALCHWSPSSKLWDNSVPMSSYPESLRLKTWY